MEQEQLEKEQPITDNGVNPRRRVRKQGINDYLTNFVKNFGSDVRWYYDVRLWSPVIMLLLILVLVVSGQQKKALKEQLLAMEETLAATVPADDVFAQTEPTVATVAPVNQEAEALARLADTVGNGRSDNVKIIIMWVAINRSEDQANGYGKSLLEEISRPNQWQGYNENMGYSDSTYKLAEQVLETKAQGGLRPLDSDMLWFVLNDDGSITVRDEFSVAAGQKWNEKTIY